MEEAVRDRFVIGMLPCIEKEEIYGKDLASLPLSTAVELDIKCAREVAACAATVTSVGAIAPTDIGQYGKQSVGVISTGKVKRSCVNVDHRTSECRCFDYSVNKCNQKVRVKNVCSKVNLVTSAETDDSDDGELYHIRSFTGEPMVKYIELHGVSLKFEIDSGSAVTAISEPSYRRNYSRVSLCPSTKKLLGYTGEKIQSIGVMSQSPISYGGVTRVLDVYVVRGGGPALLGRDFISKFNLELAPVKYCGSPISIEQLQAQYFKTFFDTLGTLKKYKIKLFLKENSQSIFIKARPKAFALREKINEEIDSVVYA